MNRATQFVAILALPLSAAALAVAASHSGPAGPAGPPGPRGSQGDTGRAAVSARLGICWEAPVWTQAWSDGSSSTWVSEVSITPAVYAGGVYSCPGGETFVSVVPQPSNSG